jgi:hypothetical protein
VGCLAKAIVYIITLENKERFHPSVSRKTLPRALAVQLPSFALFGLLLATQRTYMRLWGWKENAREAAKWEAEGRSERVPLSWSDSDW